MNNKLKTILGATLSTLAVCTLVVSCASNAKRIGVSQSQLGTKYAKQTGYFSACGTVCSEEETPGSIRHEAIRDEATLVSVGPSETCFEMVVRTGSEVDEPIDQLNPSCILDGTQARAVVDDEIVTVRDWDYTGRVETVALEAATQDSFLDFSMTEPEDRTFRVIERKVRLCCGAPASASVELELENPNLRVGASRSLLDLSWDLR